MKLARGSGRSATFLLNSVDRFGRTINPRVLAVAHEIGPRAVAYGERLPGDAALTMNLFEESAAAVSEALRRKSKDARPVRDLSAYLYRTFLRKISLARRKQTRLETLLRNNARTQFLARQSSQAEVSLLFDEVMATYDKATQQIVYRRLEGLSWKEIAAEFGIANGNRRKNSGSNGRPKRRPQTKRRNRRSHSGTAFWPMCLSA
jgi:DNA-directed RNA polymerase specialized sigma24 family protein